LNIEPKYLTAAALSVIPRFRVCIRMLLFFLTITSGITASTLGQSMPKKPFSYVDVGLIYGTISINDENYGTRWSPSAYYGGLVRTDFYAGEVGFRLYVYEYESKTIENIKVEATNYGFFWDTTPLSVNQISLNTGIFVGIHKTYARFLDETDGNLNKSGEESELILGVSGTVSWQLRPVIFFTTVSYEKVFNYYRLHQFYAGAGVRVRISIPDSVREVLK